LTQLRVHSPLSLNAGEGEKLVLVLYLWMGMDKVRNVSRS
jgi:hypothetical protein